MTSDSPDVIRDLMFVERPAGTRLSQSSTPGGNSALARDDDNSLVTHAVLFDANAFTSEEMVKIVVTTAAVVGAVGIAVGAAATKAGPQIKSKFGDLKSRLRLKAGDVVVEAADPRPEQP
ncbi:hypothetical protein [Streptomyces globisporus]